VRIADWLLFVFCFFGGLQPFWLSEDGHWILCLLGFVFLLEQIGGAKNKNCCFQASYYLFQSRLVRFDYESLLARSWKNCCFDFAKLIVKISSFSRQNPKIFFRELTRTSQDALILLLIECKAERIDC